MINKLLCILFFCFLWSCTCDQTCYQYRGKEQIWYSKNGKVKVLTTTGIIEDIVKQIGGESIDTIVLVKGELDPHTYQLVKGDDEKLAYADLIFYNGLGLEHGPSLKKHLETSNRTVSLGAYVQKVHPEKILSYEKQIDPHIWMDIALWAEAVPLIVEKLAEQDPDHAEKYRANGTLLYQEMQQRDQILRKKLASVPSEKRYLVTSHDAFNYFARAYLATEQEKEEGTWQKRFAAPEGLAPESQISTRDIREIIDHMKKYQIHVIFPESNISKDSIRKIVEAGRDYGLEFHIAQASLYGDAMGKPGSEGDTYFKMLQYNGEIIKKYLNRELP